MDGDTDKLVDDEEDEGECDPAGSAVDKQAGFPSAPQGADYSATVPFSALCELWERLVKTPKLAVKKKLLQAFMRHWKSQDFFPLIRLLLPQLDKERQTYGMKEHSLARLYVEMLGIAKDGDDAQRLVNWRKPSNKHATIEGGDFGNVLYGTLKTRCTLQKGELSIADINRCLDELNIATDRAERLRILQWLLRRTTAIEQKWLVRIILKELKTGMSEKTILGFYHPDAVELYNITSNLRKVCTDLRDPSVRLHTTAAAAADAVNTESTMSTGTAAFKNVSLFNPIKPMLASRKSPEDIGRLLDAGRELVAETKYDGERIQIHKRGQEVRLFSRNCNDVTAIYGTQVIPLVRECVTAPIAILDGELLVWDSVAGRYEQFGKAKSLAQFGRLEAEAGSGDRGPSPTPPSQASLDVGKNLGKQFCYVAFDVLFVNDRSVMELPLSQRRILLERCVPKQKQKLFEIIERRPIASLTELINELDQAIVNGDEGIIVKDVDSAYVPAERKNKWLKLKPEYIEGLGDDLDLLIVGGYYGTGVGRRGGTISHFMLGVAVPEPSRGESQGTKKEPKMFYSLCKVGSGYTDKELRVLQKTLEKHWKTFNPAAPPSWLRLAGDAAEGSGGALVVVGDGLKEKPDVYIEPRNSRILQIQAAQIVPSEKYRAGYTLRFPRVVRIRDDKAWNECLSLPEFLELAARLEGRCGARRYGETSGKDGRMAKRKSRAVSTVSTLRRPCTVVKSLMAPDFRGIETISTLFRGKEIAIMNGERDKKPGGTTEPSHGQTKAELELLVHRFGGTVVQYPTATTAVVIAARESLKVRNLIMRDAADIVHPRWIRDCVSAGELLPLEPKYMIYATPATKERLLLFTDRYGDSFTKDTTVEHLREVFAQIDKNIVGVAGSDWEGNGGGDLDDVELAEIAARLFPAGRPWWALFRGFVVYLDRYVVVGDESTALPYHPLDLVAPILRFYGATLTTTLNEQVTHVIMERTDLSRLPAIRSRLKELLLLPPHTAKHVVAREWVEESVAAHEDLDEREFTIIDNVSNKRKSRDEDSHTAPRKKIKLTHAAATTGVVEGGVPNTCTVYQNQDWCW